MKVERPPRGLSKRIRVFLEKAQQVHNSKYTYDISNYKNSYSKIKIFCPNHGQLLKTANDHIYQQQGCSLCNQERIRAKLCLGIEKFVKSADRIHLGKYDYSLVEYKNMFKKVKIICSNHGIFQQTPSNHIHNEQGCPKCKESKGERFIRSFLDKSGFKYYCQYKFFDCQNIYKLVFDFYIPDKNLCIEYDGEQHFEPRTFGGMSKDKASRLFVKCKKNDSIKNEYCKSKNIKLLRIPFYEKDIKKILEEVL